MPSITIKNIPDEIYAKIKENAALNFRSINSEILYCLNKALNPKTINPENIIARVEEMQAKYKLTPLSEQILNKSKNSGRK